MPDHDMERNGIIVKRYLLLKYCLSVVDSDGKIVAEIASFIIRRYTVNSVNFINT